uniref:EF-hand domain-containing protein n=1 Tax=Rhabditophanes sp. KR3021 TaxID=114890 RepID=A0AC35U8M2_9BILA
MAQHFQRRRAIAQSGSINKGKSTLLEANADIVQQLEMQMRRPVSLSKLVLQSKFTAKEIKAIYRAFKEASPNALVQRDLIRDAFVELFPRGDTEHYADLIFNTFDVDHTGMITFEEFITGMSVLCRGTLNEKIEWTYKMYDPTSTGEISWERLFFVITAMDDLIGCRAYPPANRELRVNHTNTVYKRFDPNNTGKITKKQFIDVCMVNPEIGDSINFLFTILPTA